MHSASRMREESFAVGKIAQIKRLLFSMRIGQKIYYQQSTHYTHHKFSTPQISFSFRPSYSFSSRFFSSFWFVILFVFARRILYAFNMRIKYLMPQSFIAGDGSKQRHSNTLSAVFGFFLQHQTHCQLSPLDKRDRITSLSPISPIIGRNDYNVNNTHH